MSNDPRASARLAGAHEMPFIVPIAILGEGLVRTP